MERVSRNRNVAHREVEGQTIIIKPQSSEVMVLNATGSMLWNLLDGEHNLDQVAAQIATEFHISPETARADVEELSRDLVEAGVAHAVD